MTEATHATFHLKSASAAALRDFASRTGRRLEAIVGDAVAAYVQDRTEFLDFLQVGIDAADRGDLISQEDMEAWFEALQRPAAGE